MIKFVSFAARFIPIVPVVFLLSSCNDFFNPKQELKVTEDELFDDWYEYRSADMALYGLQQKLVEQLVVLGDLRSDLLTVTNNADADLVAIYNFNFSKDNRYCSPENFFKLISACNNFLHILETKHPEVLDPSSPVTNYDRLYGEALCMKAWAYFNAVRIYGKVPYIPESLTTIDEIENFVNSSGTYVDSIYVNYSLDGYHNDTIYNHPVTLQKQLFDENMIIDKFTDILENDIKAVGVNYAIDNGDVTWEITTWNTWALHALLGEMYLTRGNLAKAAFHLEKIVYNSTQDHRYELANPQLARGDWYRIFGSIDNSEDIFTIEFNKNYFQENSFQDLFETRPPHKYMLKPSSPCIQLWEGSNDYYRGNGDSYSYIKGGNYNDQLSDSQVREVRSLRARRDYRSADNIMNGYDTVVYKYSIGKGTFDNDPFFIVYRAPEIHLDLAEVYTYWAFNDNGTVRTFTLNAVNILNDGSNYTPLSNRPQMGVRGRAGLGGVNLNRFPNGDLPGKQQYLDQLILSERGRELAFEGKRFYDLMRVAKRMNNPSILANAVSAKFSYGRRFQVRSYLMDENNWYIHFFD